jgi:hypothetical protein
MSPKGRCPSGEKQRCRVQHPLASNSSTLIIWALFTLYRRPVWPPTTSKSGTSQTARVVQRLSVDRLHEATEASVSLHKGLLRAVHGFMTQTTQTALANGRHKIEERLARWLLLADDRLDDHEIPLTHEFLGIMLGTARTGVTIALQELERRGYITHRRGMTVVIDRKGLEKSCNGAYIASDE